jgi:hypothetical protein
MDYNSTCDLPKDERQVRHNILSSLRTFRLCSVPLNNYIFNSWKCHQVRTKSTGTAASYTGFNLQAGTILLGLKAVKSSSKGFL